MDLGFLGGFNFNGAEYTRNSFDIVWANEINELACETYRHNIGNHIVNGDIWKVIDEIPASNVDVVIGGFPCQDISINNIKAKGVFGARSGLYSAMVEVVDRVRPKIFVAENVKALLNSNNKKSLAKVLEDFRNIGYDVSYKLYNTADFGVPQTRERVIIVGTNGVRFSHMHSSGDKRNWVSVESVLRVEGL